MGLFGDIFDFNNDGKVSFEEELFGLGMIGAISAELGTKCDVTSDDDEDDDFDDLDEEDDSDAPVSFSITLKSDADDIESDLEELRDKLQELEIDEPDDVLSRKHDRWEQRCDTVRGRIAQMESAIQERIDKLQERLDTLEDKGPDDDESAAYERWEERCEELQDRIDELEALI